MPLTERQRQQLFSTLESNGWQWRDGFIYAPNDTMWLQGASPWGDDLREFHDRMNGRLQRNESHGWMYVDARDHENLVADTRSLVEALATVLRDSHA